jgi:chromosome segregation ATPase
MKIIDQIIDRIAVKVMEKLKAVIDNKISGEYEATTVLLEGHLMEMFGERINDLKQRMASLEEAYNEFEELKEKVDDLDYELDHVKDDVSDLEEALEEVDRGFEALKTKLERIKDIL